MDICYIFFRPTDQEAGGRGPARGEQRQVQVRQEICYSSVCIDQQTVKMYGYRNNTVNKNQLLLKRI